jgi:hypothetical protein
MPMIDERAIRRAALIATAEAIGIDVLTLARAITLYGATVAAERTLRRRTRDRRAGRLNPRW